MNIIEESLPIFKANGNKVAILEPSGEQISFQDFTKQIHQRTHALKKMGVNEESKVLLFIPMSIELYITIGAVIKLGATVVFIDPWAGKEYIQNALTKVRPDYLFYTKKALPLLLLSCIRSIKNKFTTTAIQKREVAEDNSNSPTAFVDGQHSALITFTSGSSNNPKGFDRSHHFLNEQKKAHQKYFKHDSQALDLCMFPIFVLSNLASGIGSVLIDLNLKKFKPEDIHRVQKQLSSHHVASLTCSPAILESLCDHCEKESVTIDNLQYLYTGGAPVHPLLFERLQKVIPKGQLYLVYGSTEAEPIALMQAQDVIAQAKQKTLNGQGIPLGKVVEDLNYKIIAIEDRALDTYKEVAPGQMGELILSGQFVGKRYFKSPDAFKDNKIVEGDIIWHRTGDVVYQEGDLLYMMGRKHNLVIEGHESIYPLRIEPVLEASSMIKKAAFFQYDDKKSGLLLEIDKTQKLNKVQEAITKQCGQLGIKPQVTHIVDHIPRDKRHHSKVDTTAIQSVFGAKAIEELKSLSFFKRIMMYTNERFPLVGTLLFIGLFSFDSFYLFQRINQQNVTTFNLSMLLNYLTMFCVFFTLRLLDEHKDFAEDHIAYPQRVLSRGIVTLKDLRLVLYFITAAMVAMNAYLGMQSLYYWSIVAIYALLMFKEFFVADYLKSNLTLYLISHQLILPLMIHYQRQSVDQSNSYTLVNILAYVMIGSFSFYFEIARKTWSQEREMDGADSYTSAWGIPKTLRVLTISFALMIANAIYLGKALNFSFSYYVSWAALGLFNFYAIGKFNKLSNLKNSKLIELAGTLSLILGHLIMILAT